MAVSWWGNEIKYGSQNSSGNMQSIHAVLQNVHTEILVMHTYCGIASITEGNITLLFNTVKCRDPQTPASLPHQPPNCKSFSHGTVLKPVNSSSSALQDFKAQCNSNAALWFSRFLLVPPCLLCSSPDCTGSVASCQHTCSMRISVIVEWMFHSCCNHVEMLYDGMEGSLYPWTPHLGKFRKIK